MSEVTGGMVGVLVAGVLFLVGVAVGFASGKSKGKKWLEENGCYLCREKAEYESETGD